MPQLEVAIVGKNNTKAAVTGQNELLVKINSVDPGTGLATEATLLQVENNTDEIAVNTKGVLRTPNMLRTTSSGNLSSLSLQIYSASVANVGTADGTVLGAVLKAGEIDTAKTAEYDKWVYSVKNPPAYVEPTKAELEQLKAEKQAEVDALQTQIDAKAK
jgi:hypothetical protein